MSKKDPKSNAQKTTVRWLLVFCLLLTIAYTLFTFLILNKELSYTSAMSSALPGRYEVSRSDIHRSTIHTETIRKAKYIEGVSRNIRGFPAWNARTSIKAASDGQHRVIIRAINILDKPVILEEFSAHISRVGDENQILPGVSFSETAPGEYTAEVTLPDNGEWEVRGRLKKGLEIILIAQKIPTIMPR